MNDATPRLDQINIVSGDVEASIAFYRRLGVDIPEERVWRTPSGIHHVSAAEGGSAAIHLDLDSAGFARLWNRGWQGRQDLRGRIVVGFKLPSRDAVDATYADLTGKPVTAEVAEEAIGSGSRAATGDHRVTIDEIQKKTAEYYKLDLRELHSARRARRVARPRQVAMYLARELTSRSLPDIGRRFGGRDHTTVLHACRRIEALCKTDPVFQQEVDFLRKVLGRQPRA